MLSNEPVKIWLREAEKAYAMLGLLHRHLKIEERKELAEEITVQAIDAFRLELRQRALSEPKTSVRKKYYKLYASREFLLNRLVWAYSSVEEKKQEAAYLKGRGCLDHQTMLVRYLREILSLGFEHTTAHLTVGITRVLCNFATKDVEGKLYPVLVPDGQGGVDDSILRHRKKGCMERLQQRFPDFLRVVKVLGEDRFLKKENSGDSLSLVRQALKQFTPLEPRCIKLPDKFDPTDDMIVEFLPPVRDSKTNDAAYREMEFDAERRRMHSLSHPPCFSKLLEMTGLPGFEERLEVPDFIPNGRPVGGDASDPPPSDGGDLPPLSEEQKTRMGFALRRLEERRERRLPDELIVVVDGVERGRLNLDAPPKLRMALRASDRLVEFFGRDAEGRLLLGTHLLEWDDEAAEDATADAEHAPHLLLLKDRRKIEFQLRYLREDEELRGAFIDLSYGYTKVPAKTYAVAAGALLLTAAAASATFFIYRRRRRALAEE